jgi:hypothetical protein
MEITDMESQNNPLHIYDRSRIIELISRANAVYISTDALKFGGYVRLSKPDARVFILNYFNPEVGVIIELTKRGLFFKPFPEKK